MRWSRSWRTYLYHGSEARHMPGRLRGLQFQRQASLLQAIDPLPALLHLLVRRGQSWSMRGQGLSRPVRFHMERQAMAFGGSQVLGR